jgi:hypothetical protein
MLVLALSGCSAHTHVRLGGVGSVSVPPGTSVTRSSLSVSVRTSNVAAALIALGALGIATHFARDQPGSGVVYRANPLLAIEPEAPAARADAPRRVREQDCARPIEDPSANLRCR